MLALLQLQLFMNSLMITNPNIFQWKPFRLRVAFHYAIDIQSRTFFANKFSQPAKFSGCRHGLLVTTKSNVIEAYFSKANRQPNAKAIRHGIDKVWSDHVLRHRRWCHRYFSPHSPHSPQVMIVFNHSMCHTNWFSCSWSWTGCYLELQCFQSNWFLGSGILITVAVVVIACVFLSPSLFTFRIDFIISMTSD